MYIPLNTYLAKLENEEYLDFLIIDSLIGRDIQNRIVKQRIIVEKLINNVSFIITVFYYWFFYYWFINWSRCSITYRHRNYERIAILGNGCWSMFVKNLTNDASMKIRNEVKNFSIELKNLM